MNGFFLAGVFLICLGVLLLFLRAQQLPAEEGGAMSEEERKKSGFDLQRLLKNAGWFCILCGTIFLALSLWKR